MRQCFPFMSSPSDGGDCLLGLGVGAGDYISGTQDLLPDFLTE